MPLALAKFPSKNRNEYVVFKGECMENNSICNVPYMQKDILGKVGKFLQLIFSIHLQVTGIC